MVFNLPSKIVLFDTEYTTWKNAPARNWSGPREHREIVQIAAIKVDTDTLRETDSFNTLIKPRINPNLSDFFIALTGITQVMVDSGGTDFRAAWERFETWRGSYHAYSFGKDASIIKENCELFGIPYDAAGNLHNICTLFEAHGIDTNRYHSSTIVSAFGKAPRKGAHNALNDARSILDGLVLLSNTRR